MQSKRERMGWVRSTLSSNERELSYLAWARFRVRGNGLGVKEREGQRGSLQGWV